MPDGSSPRSAATSSPLPPGSLVVRGVVGGAFMGLANLVPGISGGTMLLAAGVYPQFISAVAEVTTLRFRAPVLLLLGCVGAGASSAIGVGSGVIGTLLDLYPSGMYSLFIGLTLGGVPLLTRLLRPVDRTVVCSACVAVALMGLLAAGEPARVRAAAEAGAAASAMLVIAGFAGGAAMILPGVSGAYLLLVLGQYRPIVDAVASVVASARAADAAAAAATLPVLLPVALGVGLGIVGVSNLVKLLLARYRRATLGFLLGLLLGSVIGLWPFAGVPSPAQAGAAAALAVTGFVFSWGISRPGVRDRESSPQNARE
jgi:putative membrane protein